jgi:hypothetical protein
MADRVLRTDWKRIGRSGPTVDGRVISPQAIDDMAASYNKELFTAMIWPEHQRWYNMGTVEALRSAANEEGGRDLFAIISPNQYYLSANAAGQKLFTSMEIRPDFRKTGKAYLEGLGATDDPASAATSEMRFSKNADQGGILLTKSIETTDQAFEDPAPTTLLDQIKALFKNQPNEEQDMATKAALQQFSTEMAAFKELLAKLTPPADDKKPEDKTDDLATQFAALKQSQDALLEKFNAVNKPADDKPAADAFKALQEQFSALEKKLADALKEQPGTDGGEHFNAGDDHSQYL